MNALFSFIAVSLKSLGLNDFCLERLKLSSQEFALLTRLKLFLLSSLAAALQHFNLLVGVVDFRLTDLDGLERMLMCLGKIDEPLTDLLKESVGFFKLLVQMMV